jgi:hypothetical protein
MQIIAVLKGIEEHKRYISLEDTKHFVRGVLFGGIGRG